MTPGGGGVNLGLGQGSATHPPTHPPTHLVEGLCPPLIITYKHLIEKPPLAVVWRKDATPFGYVLSPIPRNDLLAMLMKCVREPNRHPSPEGWGCAFFFLGLHRVLRFPNHHYMGPSTQICKSSTMVGSAHDLV